MSTKKYMDIRQQRDAVTIDELDVEMAFAKLTLSKETLQFFSVPKSKPATNRTPDDVKTVVIPYISMYDLVFGGK